jgi:hypothetical protein
MNHDVTSTSTSLLSIVFMALPLADDIVGGLEPAGISHPGGVLILAV